MSYKIPSNLTTKLIWDSAAANTVIFEEDQDNLHPVEHLPTSGKTINFWQFSRKYQIGGVSVIDIAILFFILYLINKRFPIKKYQMIIVFGILLILILNIYYKI